MSRRGFGRRKKVLQLGDGSTKPAPYGLGYRPGQDRSKDANPIGALDMMMHYEDSDEEAEESIPQRNHRDQGGSARQVQKFVASSERLEPANQEVATTSQTSAVTNGHSVSPDTTKPKDEIDTKVMDFLAELDAFDGPDTTSGDGADGIDGEPMATTPQHVTSREDDWGSMDSEEEVLKPPTEPATDWQQCLDDGTHCYYYWNCVTNQVTWEIPPEYSQYLLRYKEYEKLLAKYEEDKETQGSMPKPKRKRKRRKKKKEDVPSETTQAYGPEMPESSSQSEPVVEGPANQVPVPQFDVETPRPPLPPPTEPQQPVSTQQLIGPFLPPPPPPPEEDEEETASAFVTEMPSSSSTEQQQQQQHETNQERDDESSLGDDVDEYIHRKLEEPVFTHYEFVNKKYEGPQPRDDLPQSGLSTSVVTAEYQGDDDLDIDIDDIDRELEQALERKQAELQSKEVDSTPMKRPLTDPMVDEASQKRQKTNDDEEMESNTNNLKLTVRHRVAALAEVTELCTQVTDKLEFLEVTRSGLSRLQILLVEIQTRIEDWQDGGLSTDVFLRRLRAASGTLSQYESSAAPPGWTCHWDSKFKRYFYFNEVTEETQWDYPGTDDYVEDTAGNHGIGDDDGIPLPPCEESVAPQPVITQVIPPPPPPPAVTQSHAATGQEPTLKAVPVAEVLPPVPPPPPPVMAEHPTKVNVRSVAPPPETEPSSVSEMSCDKDEDPYVADSYNYGPMFHMMPPPPPPMDADESDPAVVSATDNDTQHPDQKPQPPPLVTAGNLEEKDVLGEHLTDMAEPEIQQFPGTVSFETASHIHAEPVLASLANSSAMSAEENVAMDTSEAAAVSMATEQETEEPGPSLSQISADSVTQSLSPAPAMPTEGCSSQDSTAAGLASKNPSTSVKEKKRKKDKSLVGGGLSMKKKNVTGLVQKWQKVQKEVEKEMAHQKKIAKIVEEDSA